MQEATEQVSFFRNLIKDFIRQYHGVNYEKLAKKVVLQSDYFVKMIRWISYTQKRLLIFGYDTPFMELKGTQEQLIKAAKGEGKHRPTPIEISAIFSEAQSSDLLEDLAEESAFVSVWKIPGPVSAGYIVHDWWGVNLWNSKRLTPHPEESKKGVIWRNGIENEIGARKLARGHYKRVEAIQKKGYCDKIIQV